MPGNTFSESCAPAGNPRSTRNTTPTIDWAGFGRSARKCRRIAIISLSQLHGPSGTRRAIPPLHVYREVCELKSIHFNEPPGSNISVVKWDRPRGTCKISQSPFESLSRDYLSVAYEGRR